MMEVGAEEKSELNTLEEVERQLRGRRSERELAQHGHDGRPSVASIATLGEDPLLDALMRHHYVAGGVIYPKKDG